MMVDRVSIRTIAGAGGSGVCSFARHKYEPKGGPDGGDGGHGGSVILRGDRNLSTLLDYRYRNTWRADRGQHGKGKKMTGKSASDVYLPVPPGTEVRDARTGDLIGEVLSDGDTLKVARGGRGGRGNVHFATPTHQAPREWEPGEEGEDREIELVLKLIADVGLVGQPNAGKSTLLAAVSAARPKIADYPFTTLEPNLGVAGLSDSRSFVLADIPGLIEGASEGKGLGHQFLQHLERTRVLAYLVPVDAIDPESDYRLLRQEIRAYSEELFNRPHILVFSKLDLWPGDEAFGPFDAPEAREAIAISAASSEGIEQFKELCWRTVDEIRRQEESDDGDPFT